LPLTFIHAGDSGNGFFLLSGGRFYLKGIVSASITNQGACDITNHALFMDVLKYYDWIEDPTGREPKCGVMSRSSGLVKGGTLSTREQFPWQVSIFVREHFKSDYEPRGSGSLITMKHILATAATVCYPEDYTLKFVAFTHDQVKLFIGTLKFDDATATGAVQVNGNEIDRIVAHPIGYYSVPRTADIAIITLKSRLARSNFISPVCMWRGSQSVSEIVGQVGYGVGYGIDENGKKSGIRKHARMIIQNEPYCKQNWGNQTANATSKFFCAQGVGSETACGHDHPIYIKTSGFWFIRGLFSKAYHYVSNGACADNRPILYEDLSIFQDWIAANSRIV